MLDDLIRIQQEEQGGFEAVREIRKQQYNVFAKQQMIKLLKGLREGREDVEDGLQEKQTELLNKRLNALAWSRRLSELVQSGTSIKDVTHEFADVLRPSGRPGSSSDSDKRDYTDEELARHLECYTLARPVISYEGVPEGPDYPSSQHLMNALRHMVQDEDFETGRREISGGSTADPEVPVEGPQKTPHQLRA